MLDIFILGYHNDKEYAIKHTVYVIYKQKKEVLF